MKLEMDFRKSKIIIKHRLDFSQIGAVLILIVQVSLSKVLL